MNVLDQSSTLDSAIMPGSPTPTTQQLIFVIIECNYNKVFLNHILTTTSWGKRSLSIRPNFFQKNSILSGTDGVIPVIS